MVFFRRPLMTVAYSRRWAFALSLAVLLLWTAAGMAQTPVPGTPIVNRASVQYKDANGNALPSASHTISSPLAGGPRLRLAKTADSDPVAAGAALTYSLRYDNTGNASATGVTVVDTLPAGVTFQSASAGGVYAPAAHTITWNIGALVAGTGGSVTATVLVGAGLAIGTPIVNTASLASAATAAETASLTTLVGAGSNLILTKTADKATVLPNGAIAYTIAYRNQGNRDALQVLITDQIPANTAYIPRSALPAAVLAGNVLTWNLNTVPASAQGTVGFQVRAAPFAQTEESITIANVATVLSTTQAGTSNTVTTTVPRRSLVLLKMDTPDPARAGMTLTYTILSLIHI